MKIGSKLQYEVPDKCPEDCVYKGEFIKYGQNALCGQCPVFVCKEDPEDKNREHTPLVPSQHYRDDWARNWVEFFKTGKEPELKLKMEEK